MESSLPPVIDSGERNWLNLPRDIVLSIFRRLDTVDILICTHNVCTTWRKISKDPFLYRTIILPNFGDLGTDLELEVLCHRAVDYSCGQLIDISIDYIGTDDLLHHIANSASHLRRLRLACCYSVTDEGLCEVAEKLPCLEELDISISRLSKDPLEVIGQCCPRLKTFKFNNQACKHLDFEYDDDDDDNEEAFAIAQTMPGLCRLQLFGNKMTNDGLLAILDGCPHLESLDIRHCFKVNLVGSLEKRCKEQIKYLRLPNDDTDDYPFETEFHDGSYYEDYSSEFSDTILLSDFDFDDNHYDFDFDFDDNY
ncbi:F-box protein SKIP19 [Lathyrus oleraceus]|uniref:F-box domain-containing protein n=1 Tax=Pisum sativum TaxID=3888 RepID=A0A9D5H076_PEA|nr:F-box protein SKIP19-like [Pisum sativum]KAI5447556.1 hypothetical protein KIW84_015128 [Pisum sativum]